MSGSRVRIEGAGAGVRETDAAGRLLPGHAAITPRTPRAISRSGECDALNARSRFVKTVDNIEDCIPGRVRARLLRRLSDPAPSTQDSVLRLEQPPNRRNVPRWGHGVAPAHPGLSRLLAEYDDEFSRIIASLEDHREALLGIPREEEEGGTGPCWVNPMFIGLDGAALYRFIRERRPRTYLEIGSGYSTRFAARAKRDGDLATQIVSIDPEPRAEVDALCDEVIRRPLEDVDMERFGELGTDDVLFFDGSHRVFMHNDVSVFWLDALPRVRPGVLCGIHDVWLPDDYPPGHAEKYWSEHYLLAVALLFGERLRPVLACHYTCTHAVLSAQLDGLWDAMGLNGLNAYGSAFWFERSEERLRAIS